MTVESQWSQQCSIRSYFDCDSDSWLPTHWPFSGWIGPEFFTVSWCFPKLWSRTDLQHEESDESLTHLDDFIKDVDVIKKGSTAALAVLFYHLMDMLGGHHVEDEAWEQFSHSKKVLKLSSLQTKNAKGKTASSNTTMVGKNIWHNKTMDYTFNR